MQNILSGGLQLASRSNNEVARGDEDQSKGELVKLHRKGHGGSRRPRSAEQVEQLYALHQLWLASIQPVVCLGWPSGWDGTRAVPCSSSSSWPQGFSISVR